MRIRFLRRHSMVLLTGFALITTLRAGPPQEGRGPAFQSAGPVDRGAYQAAPVPQAQGPSAPHGQRSGASQRSADFVPARVKTLYIYPGTRTLVPPGWPRCGAIPNLNYWQMRDISREIQWMSRSGFIPVSPIGDSVEALSDYTQWPAGWRAYGISVPIGGTVQVEVKHTKAEGWFRLMLMNKWGVPDAGMLQAAMAPRPLMVTYRNPSKEDQAIYVIVDDPAWWSDAKDPYTLLIRRDWDPARTDLSQVKMVAGLWGATPSVSAEFRGPSLSGPAVYPH
jgi:hypothetical protein